jgi:hypothetical protein
MLNESICRKQRAARKGTGTMGKTLALAFGGIFVGALAMELLNRTGVTKAVEDKAKQVADTFAKGFKEGWGDTDAETETEAAQPEPATA